MFTPRSLDVLFLTNFSDYCFRCIPAIAQLADALRVRLTILHVYDPARTTRAAIEAQLHSFFPEADRYTSCHRLAVPGSLNEAIRQHLEGWPVDLIVAPASDAVGFPRLGARSSRSRLIKQSGVPIWTIGRGVLPQRLQRPVRNVACWLDFDSDRVDHLEYALEYANKLQAKLHLLRALPMIDEGMLSLGAENRALEPTMAAAEILRLCANAPVVPEVHVARGPGRATLARMLRECDADAVFLHNEESVMAEWLGLGLRLCDGLPCPAICTGDALRGPVWNLEPGRTNRIPEMAPLRISVSPVAAVSRVSTGA